MPCVQLFLMQASVATEDRRSPCSRCRSVGQHSAVHNVECLWC